VINQAGREDKLSYYQKSITLCSSATVQRR